MIKAIKYTAMASAAMLALGLTSCKNSNNDFLDYEGGISAYFPYQYLTRTITLGEEPNADNSMDIQHKCVIVATQGGAYKSKDLKIDVMVENSLADHLTFPDGTPVKAMPSDYYSLESTTLKKVADYQYGTVVTLTDAFFADPDAVKETYVIPLRMVKAEGADRIITGVPDKEGSTPASTDRLAWKVAPQDFVLYCVRYINEWTGSYCRRGEDTIKDNATGVTSTVKRQADVVERDEVVYLTTKSLTKTIFPVSIQYGTGDDTRIITCELELTFDDKGDCTISTNTPGMTASGSGKFVKDGEKKSINNQDCDALYLTYSINFGPVTYDTKDTLVMRHREVKGVFDFGCVYNK